METEIWKPVPDLPFMASSLGRVRTLDRDATVNRNGKTHSCRLKGRILKPWVGRNGYLIVSRQDGDERPKYFVHRLVCWAFNSGFKDGLTVNHINGIKSDNRPENLEWCTRAENTAHQWQIGLVNLRRGHNPHAKLTPDQVLEIRATSNAAMAPKFGVTESLIARIRRGHL